MLRKLGAMEIDTILPGHGDVANRVALQEFEQFLAEQYAAVKATVERGMSADEVVKALPFEKYQNWRNYARRGHSIRSLHELITTGKAAYFK